MMQETKPEMAPVDKAGTIEEIKEAYQTGLYFINAEKIAEKIVTFHSGIPV